jgi:hypothetical protein
MRARIPEQIKEARWIVREREMILDDARGGRGAHGGLPARAAARLYSVITPQYSVWDSREGAGRLKEPPARQRTSGAQWTSSY